MTNTRNRKHLLMRLRGSVFLVVLLLLAGCAPELRTLRFVASNPPERGSLVAVIDLIAANSDLQFELILAEPGRPASDYIAAGEADLALISNDQRYVPGVYASVPIVTALMHIIYRAEVPPASVAELFSLGEIFAGDEDESTFRIARQLAELSGVDPEVIRPVTGGPRRNHSVIFISGPISRQFDDRLSDRALFSLGDPASLGRGTIAEGIAARIRQARPAIIPAFAYGTVQPEPVLTLALDTYVAIGAQVSEFAAFQFTRALVENKAELSLTRPSMFAAITEDFDRASLSFPIHPGAQRYLDRDQPTLLERYAELLNFSVYLLIALAGAIAASLRWNSRRKKERADGYYRKVLEIRHGGPYTTAADKKAAADAVRVIYEEAFDKLMDERLAANESFQILISLCDNTLREIE